MPGFWNIRPSQVNETVTGRSSNYIEKVFCQYSGSGLNCKCEHLKSTQFLYPFAYFTKGKKICKTASQPAITCSKLTTETLEQGVKFAQN